MTDEERRAKNAAVQTRYRATHKKEIAEYMAKYRAAHKEEARIVLRAYRVTHQRNRSLVQQAHQAAYFYKWYWAHKEEDHARKIGYAKGHPEACRLHSAKRRTLGFVLLNKPFVGSDGHHIDKEHIIYIPQALHRSISHDQWTGRNMDKINALAYEWLARD